MNGFIVTVDLDSTVADTGHRQHMIDRENGTDWDLYSQACGADLPIEGAVALIRMLTQAGYEVHALSARRQVAFTQTEEWYAEHDIPITQTWLNDGAKGDHKPGQHEAYKVAKAREIEKVTGKKIALHIDDWAAVAVAFMAAGIPTICVRTPQEIAELVAENSRQRA